MEVGLWLCGGAVLAFQAYGISGLVASFLPSRHIEPGYAEWSDYSSSEHREPEVVALYDRVVWMIIDALPASWVLEEPSSFLKTRALLTEAGGLGLTAICQPPTVTMPRHAPLTHSIALLTGGLVSRC
jgi:ethanolaminephosphotransferase